MTPAAVSCRRTACRPVAARNRPRTPPPPPAGWPRLASSQPGRPSDDPQPHGRAGRSQLVEQRRARSSAWPGSARGGSRRSIHAALRAGTAPPRPPAASRVTVSAPRRAIRLSRPGPVVARPPAACATAASVRIRGWTPPASAGWVPRPGRSSSAAPTAPRPAPGRDPRRRRRTGRGARRPPVSTSSRAARWPRWLAVTVGVPSVSRSVSEMTTAFGSDPPGTLAQHSGESRTAHLLSALRDHERLHRGVPACRHASRAQRWAKSCPLSSPAPRA